MIDNASPDAQQRYTPEPQKKEIHDGPVIDENPLNASATKPTGGAAARDAPPASGTNGTGAHGPTGSPEAKRFAPHGGAGYNDASGATPKTPANTIDDGLSPQRASSVILILFYLLVV